MLRLLARDGRELWSHDCGGPVLAVAWGPGIIAAGTTGGCIHFVDEAGRMQRCAQLPCPVSAATWSDAAGGLLVGGVDAVYLLSASGREMVLALEQPGADPPANVTALAACGSLAAAATSRGRFAILDVVEWKVRTQIDLAVDGPMVWL